MSLKLPQGLVAGSLPGQFRATQPEKFFWGRKRADTNRHIQVRNQRLGKAGQIEMLIILGGADDKATCRLTVSILFAVLAHSSPQSRNHYLLNIFGVHLEDLKIKSIGIE